MSSLEIGKMYVVKHSDIYISGRDRVLGPASVIKIINNEKRDAARVYVYYNSYYNSYRQLPEDVLPSYNYYTTIHPDNYTFHPLPQEEAAIFALGCDD